jgi:2-dehydro-3-deoxyphosphooctonate aldolase (KDO 8-P synthase)
MEDTQQTIEVAKKLGNIMKKYPETDFYFKASFDKANRTSGKSFRGIGMAKGLSTLDRIRKTLKIKVLTDVHNEFHPRIVSAYVDALQIPAFLCRQTTVIQEVAKASKIINIKKGQFLAPEDVKHILDKIEEATDTSEKMIMITERGTCFGYHNLVVDFRSFLKMKEFGYPVIFDATHSQQEPSKGEETGGSRKYTVPMILGAVATGVDGIFMEVHPSPPNALCDGATSLYLRDVECIVKQILKIRRAINEKS